MSSKCMLINLLHSEQPRKDLLSQILKFSVHCILLNIRAKKKRRKTSFIKKTINGHVTHYHKLMSRMLHCQHFISNKQMIILVVFPHVNIQ